jgi:hypothetical protein
LKKDYLTTTGLENNCIPPYTDPAKNRIIKLKIFQSQEYASDW